MPECPEITILSQYLSMYLRNKTFEKLEVVSGKYLTHPIGNINKLSGKRHYKITEISSKGKLLWFKLKGDDDMIIYLTSHLGMTGFWNFGDPDELEPSDRARIIISDRKGEKFVLCYRDPRNFGNIEIYDDTDEFANKIAELAPDALKENFTNEKFLNLYTSYMKKSAKRRSQNICIVLMKQKKSEGIISGIGNYLVAEILYVAKISPYRTMRSLSENEIATLWYAIQYVTKLSYYNNRTGYMTHFDGYTAEHKKMIDDGELPNYHEGIKLRKTDKFVFKVYQQDYDPDGNAVIADRGIHGDRTTYWVGAVQV